MPYVRTASYAGIYVLSVHMTQAEVAEVQDHIGELGALVCAERQHANMLLTCLRAPRRIEQHTSEEERVRCAAYQASKPIVEVAWLEACRTARERMAWDPYRAYPAASSPQKRKWKGEDEAQATETVPTPAATHDAPASPTDGKAHEPKEAADSSATPSATSSPTSQEASPRSLSPKDTLFPGSSLSSGHIPTADEADPPDEADEAAAWAHAPSWTNTESALFRSTPLHSRYNQGLVDELQLLRAHRQLTSDPFSEMAYMRAAAAVKAVPYSLESVPEATLCTLKGIGRKMATSIRQFYTHGSIPEANVIRQDDAVQTMIKFTALYGIGPRAAQQAYKEGCRTAEDLAKTHAMKLSGQLGVVESCALLPDFEQRIPRAEVEQIADEVRADSHQVMQALRTACPDARGAVAGSYRRGSSSSGDVDMVATDAFASFASAGAALQWLVDRLRTEGRVTHTISVSQRAQRDARMPTPDADALGVDVAQVVYRSTPTSVHRRVDIVFAPLAQYGAALLGWTGGILYERDLRRRARAKGYVVGGASYAVLCYRACARRGLAD